MERTNPKNVAIMKPTLSGNTMGIHAVSHATTTPDSQ